MKRTLEYLLLLGLTLGAYFFVYTHFSDVAASDPDRYFHLALARQGAIEGIVRAVPQVEDLGWDKGFIEKNFLFTWLTGRAYSLGLEPAVLRVVPCLGICFFIMLFITIAGVTSPYLAAWLILSMLLSPDMGNRVSLLRPHLLAFFAFSLTLFGLLRRKPIIGMVGAIIFGLAYHANYLVVLLVIAGAGFLRKKDPTWLRSLVAVAAGLFLGIIFNPFFPANVLAGANSFRIATNLGGLGPEDRPLEVVAVSTQEFLSLFGPYVALTILGLLTLFRNKQWRERLSPEMGVLVCVTSLFWILSLISRRAIEYALPVSMIFLAYTYRDLKNTPAFAFFRTSLMVIPALLLWPKGVNFYRHTLVAGVSQNQVIAAVSHLPDSGNEKVFNCEWDNGSFLLYYRPNLRFIDLSDAILLKNVRPELYDARVRLRHGGVAFPYGLIRNVFGAKYVLCDHRQIVAQLESDPFFDRIFPKEMPREELRPAGFTVLYQLNENRLKHFTISYDIKLDSHWERADLRPMPNLPPSAYINLNDGNSQICKLVRVAPNDIDHFAGASLLGIGGGTSIEIRRNSDRLAKVSSPTTHPRILHSLIPLNPPLRKHDEIELRVCQGKDSRLFGVATSFWKPKEVAELCAEKSLQPPSPEGNDWRISSEKTKTCVGTVLPPTDVMVN